MAHKKHNAVTAEVIIEAHSHSSERAHLLEHVHFLEERTSELEMKVELLRDVFTGLLELDEDDDDEDSEDEDDEMDFLFRDCRCLWDEDESC